jgi:hypothetical protein
VIEKGTSLRLKILGVKPDVAAINAIGTIKEDYLGYVVLTLLQIAFFDLTPPQTFVMRHELHHIPTFSTHFIHTIMSTLSTIPGTASAGRAFCLERNKRTSQELGFGSWELGAEALFGTYALGLTLAKLGLKHSRPIEPMSRELGVGRLNRS